MAYTWDTSSISFNLKEAIWSLTKKKASKQRKKKLIITLDSGNDKKFSQKSVTDQCFA